MLVFLKIKSMYLKLNRVLLFISALSIFFMVVIDCLNALGAKVGVMIVPNGKTFMEELLVVVVYIGIGYVALNGKLIKTEIIKSRVPLKVSFLLDIFTFLLIMTLSAFIFFKNIDTFVLFFEQGIALPGILPIPKWPVQLIIVLSFLNIAVCTLLQLIETLINTLPSRS